MRIAVSKFGFLLAAVAGGLWLVAGCASQVPVDDNSAAMGQLGHGLGGDRGVDALRHRLTGTDHGLEIRRCTMPPGSGALREALSAFVDGDAADLATLQRLDRNGLQFVRVPMDRVDALQAALENISVAASEWHGQAPLWRSLLERPIGPLSRALAIDGRVRLFDRGVVRLNMRAWTVLMEDGPRMHLELVPEHRIPRPQDYRHLLGQPGEAGETLATAALDILLDSRYAYVLIGEASKQSLPSSADRNASGPGAAGRVGPVDFAGPQAQPPSTIGEWLLQADAPADGRLVLIFVPRIPMSMFPQTAAANLD